MKLKMLRLIKSAILVVICVCVVGGLFTGCKDNLPVEETGTASTTYTVVFENKGGTPLSNVDVRVYADTSKTDLVAAGKTDAEGRMTFTAVTGDGYIAVLKKLPVGYTVEESYPLTGETTLIVPTVGAMTDADMDSITYFLGDAVLDFTVTAADGTEYTLSELLQDKKAVVLNFWYLGCAPCKMEFPYVQEAYELYSDEIALLALNPVDGNNAEITAYQQENGLTFPMVSCDLRWQNMMQLTAYPTTVVIDRYGNICMIHSGMVTSADPLIKMFEHFSAEDYEQEFFNTVEEIPA